MSDAETRGRLAEMTREELERECCYLIDRYYGLIWAMRDAPDMPHPKVLRALNTAAKYPEDWNSGKALQRELGLVAVPPVAECESGAGLWARILPGLRALNERQEAGE